MTEQGFLRASIFATVGVAALGIVFGLQSGSFSIAFDGAYSLADAAMTTLALWVSRLIEGSTDAEIPRGLRARFTMGFWHLEPIVLGINGTLLITVAIYALINAIIAILGGGNDLLFDVAIVYAAITLAICLAMAFFGARANRKLGSDFVALDVKAWVMSAGITSALLIAFLSGQAVRGTTLAWISPYVDPVVLALVCIVIIPIPVGAVRRALSQILLITPADLKAHVENVASNTLLNEGFLSYRAYVAKVGRATQIELYFIVPKDFAARTIEQWDRTREEIGAAIGGKGPNRWLTIAFTADVNWAE